MPRGLSVTNVNASQAQALNLFMAIDIAFPGGTQAYCTGPRNYTFNGLTYLSDGSLGAVDAIEEGADTTSRTVQIVMAGMNATLGAALQANNFRLQPVNMYIGFTDQSWNTLDTPGLIQLLRMSGVDRQIQRNSQDNTISDKWVLSCESYLIDMNRTNGLRQVNSDQRARFSGDLFFSLKPTLAYRLLYWGQNPYALPTASDGVGAKPPNEFGHAPGQQF